MRPKMEYNFLVSPGPAKSILRFLDLIQERTKVLINDSTVPNTFGSLDHRFNMACVFLFYGYYNELCSSELGESVSRESCFSKLYESFPESTSIPGKCIFQPNYLYVERPWEVFPLAYDINKFKYSIHRHYSLFPLSSNLFPLNSHNALQEYEFFPEC